MSSVVHPVLLCGGSGTRLWPLSRASYPKQFAALAGDRSLFQAAAERLSGEGFAAPMVVTGEAFRFIVVEQLAGCGQVASDILIEPEPRDTAAAVCAAAMTLAARDPDALMLVAPSDHVIRDPAGFRAAIAAARPAAEAGQIVTFGIQPSFAATSYGWLELSGAVEDGLQSLCGFVEKPDVGRAQALLEGGRHLWNAGLFLSTAGRMCAAFATHAPAIADGVRAALAGQFRDLAFTRVAAEPWAALPRISLDYAVMEAETGLSVQPYAGVWSDLGDWNAVWREGAADASGTVTEGEATAIDCEGSLLHAGQGGQRLVGIGLSDMVAVALPDAVLVAPRSRTQEVKDAVAALQAQGVTQAVQLPRAYRPWGWYESLVTGPRFQVKRIVVNPGGILSLQSHHHRAEHWVVVEGTAQVTIGGTERLVAENESIYIPLGVTHRLENPGKLPLTLIEVQTGAYLGEDDIVRLEDAYARDRTVP